MFKILQKELRSLLKDRRAMMMGLLMPIILISVFSLAFGGINNQKDRKTNLLICDEDKSAVSDTVIRELDSVKTLSLAITTVDTALDLIKKGKYSSALILHKGFGDSVNTQKHLPWEFKYDVAQQTEMQIMQQYVMQNLFQTIGKIKANSAGADDMGAMMATIQLKKSREFMKIESAPIEKAPDNQGIVQAVAGTAVMMLMFSLTAMGGRILEEKENGTLKRLLYSPLKASDILMGKMLSSILFAIMQLMIMFSFSAAVFGLMLIPKLAAVLLVIISTAFACSGFGMFLASVVKSREQLQSLSTLAILSMSVIGGSMVPSFLMPPWMQTVGHVSINYWSIQSFFDIFDRQLAITDPIFLEKVGVLLLFGTVLSTLAFRLFRKNVVSMA